MSGFNHPARHVRKWEQGRTEPDQPGRAYLAYRARLRRRAESFSSGRHAGRAPTEVATRTPSPSFLEFRNLRHMSRGDSGRFAPQIRAFTIVFAISMVRKTAALKERARQLVPLSRERPSSLSDWSLGVQRCNFGCLLSGEHRVAFDQALADRLKRLAAWQGQQFRPDPQHLILRFHALTGNESEDPLHVRSHRHQAPLAADLVVPAQQELAKAENRFDDAEHGLRDVLALGVQLFASGVAKQCNMASSGVGLSGAGGAAAKRSSKKG
jgi:hypothetical protein